MGQEQAPTLADEHVILQQLSANHHDDLVAAVADGDIWRTWYTSIPSPEGMADEVERRLTLQSAGRMAPWAVVDPATGRAIGMTTYMNLDPANRRLEIGSTWLGRASRGTAVNPAMKLLLLRRAFEELDCIAVEFRTHWHNRQSRAAIAKLGAKQDAVLRQHQIMPDGSMRDTVVFSILDNEWPTVRLGLQARLANAAAPPERAGGLANGGGQHE